MSRSNSTVGWHARCVPYEHTAEFTPTLESLVFGVVLETMGGTSLTLALFTPDIVVDAMGRILQVQESDFVQLVALAKQIQELPSAGSFLNTWRIDCMTTCQPFDRLYIRDSQGKFTPTGVYGWSKGGPHKLSSPVGDYTHLPTPFVELMTLVWEGREGYEGEAAEQGISDDVLKLVRAARYDALPTIQFSPVTGSSINSRLIG